jgi:transposase
MIVIGLDVHKQSVTAVAVDEAGRPLSEKAIPVGSEELLGWASALDAERVWAVEDCRQLTRWLERQLLGVGEDVVRVPPKLTVPERRAGRTRGKFDPIDALAIARAALREPDLSRPRAGEQLHREIKLLVDHRDDLVDQRRRTQQRLRCTCFSSTQPSLCRCGCSAAPRISTASAVGWPAKSRSCRCGSRASSSRPAAR